MADLDGSMSLKINSTLKSKLYGLAEAQGIEAADIVRELIAEKVASEERKFIALNRVFADAAK